MTPHLFARRAAIGAILAMPFVTRMALGQEQHAMKIGCHFHDQTFSVTLEDNASAREFAGLLPLDLTISDFSTNEKIAYLPAKLRKLTRGPFPNASAGDLCYYVPWGNLAFFHAGYESTRDLVRLGRLEGDVSPLLVRGEFLLRIERLT